MRVELIAEVSSNHGGSIPLAKEFIARFAEVGADWIKFQTTRVKHLRRDDPQYDWFTKAELSDDAHHELKAVCEAEGVKFLTTIYHPDEVPLMVALQMPLVKLGSGEADASVLVNAARGAELALLRSMHSTGQRSWWDRVKDSPDRWLSTVCRYPASERACLKAIDDCVGYYRVVGYSDHSVGLDMAQWAIECGAQIIEKHVRLPHQAREGRAFEATVEDFKALRTFADEGPERFVGRWSA
jgi:sialic acid synthase SpsE